MHIQDGRSLAAYFSLSALALSALMATGDTLAGETVPAEEAQGAPAGDEQVAIEENIRLLGSDSYAEREAAQNRLAEYGFAAFDALKRAEDDEDIEIAARARYLVRLIQVQWALPEDSRTVQNLLQNYGGLANPEERLAKIRELALLPDDQGLAALCRLVRFENSEVLSKWAAVELVNRPVPDGVDLAQRGQTILSAIARSPRPAADWLRIYARAHDDPSAAVERWGEVVAAEQAVFDQFPEQSRIEIVAALLRHQISWLDRLDRDEEAVEAMRRLVQLERGDTEHLLDLLRWLVERQAWPVVDELAEKFDKRIRQEPLLLYALADARLRQGREDDANELAQAARETRPDDFAAHLQTARDLQQRGQKRWAEAEYRSIIDSGKADNGSVLYAHFLLAEMIYDRADYQEAAKLLDSQVQQIDEQLASPMTEANLKGFLSKARGQLSARMHYYYAMYYHETDDGAKEAEHLDQALDYDKNDIDVLIALFRMREPGEERRKRTEQLIEETAAMYQKIIDDQPEDATPFNQLAWLWANTGRRLEDALAYSQKSLELKPNEAGYLDTLARCYFALGKYEEAVKEQERAVELDPHSGQMNRQLKLFREALDQANGSRASADR